MTNEIFVVAHKEDTSHLESALFNQGFSVHVQRGPYTAEQQGWPSSMKCLVNHTNVWRQVAAGCHSVIVVEADFVPVKNLATRSSPLPSNIQDKSVGFAWLYSAGSILYGFDKDGFPHGHGNTTVAYILTPRTASILIEFSKLVISNNPTLAYSNWETHLGIYLRKQHGILNYIPVYCYGEHGGIPQPEHSAAGVRAWHQADILLDTLEFQPPYAKGWKLIYKVIRFRSIFRGWYRFLTLRFYHPKYINSDSAKGRFAMGLFSLKRLLKLA